MGTKLRHSMCNLYFVTGFECCNILTLRTSSCVVFKRQLITSYHCGSPTTRTWWLFGESVAICTPCMCASVLCFFWGADVSVLPVPFVLMLVCLSVCEFVSQCTWLYITTSAGPPVRGSASKWVYQSIREMLIGGMSGVLIHLSVCRCICAYISAGIRVSVSIYPCMCARIAHVYPYLSVLVCPCVRISVRMEV